MSLKTSRLNRFDFWTLITIVGYVIVIFLLILPLFNIFKASFIDKETGALSLSNYREFFSKSYYTSAIPNSLLVSFGGTLGALIFGIPLAYFTSRYKIWGKTLLATLAVLSLLSPPFIGAYAWIMMLGKKGFLRLFLLSFGIELPSIFGPGGIILVYTLQYYPFVFLLTSGALMTVDRSLEEAAENLGASSLRKFFRVTLPLVLPSLSAGALIAFMMSLANFGTPMILGRRFRVLPTMAYNLYTSEIGENPGLASTVSILLILVSTLVLFFQRYAATRRKYSSALINRPVVKSLQGLKNVGAHLICYLIVFISTLPLAVVMIFSFRKTKGPVFHPGFALQSYRKIFHDVPKTITNSILFSVSAVILIVVVGTLLGFVLSRKRNLPAKFLDPLLMIPYIVPGTVLGIGFIVAFNRKPIYLVGTSAIIILSYFIRRLPYSVRSSASILRQIDPSLEEAGINLGSPPGRTFRKVTLPLMMPGIISGAIMSWVTAINELSSSIVLYVGNTMTMPVRIYLSVLDGLFGTASALATILLVATGLALFIVNQFLGMGRESLVG
ncbi:ABC transporter permease [candidate division KSB3 bacterium]|uniref:ABC transporter permease n=1 Tax=candidate division KSB3 bacterium TaxID=2044937 RepID=A0A2G6KDF5_9BACT|nr:MAG: ABC transporter permease [candidate division KSB3 bacterium]